ncbi:MAG TPA: class F sortase [Marmoricola sp.]|nr:class F sortase [Marmoricola sp.]
MSRKPLRSPIEQVERAGRLLMAAVLWLLLAATVGGLVFPSPAPAKIPVTNPSEFHQLAHPVAPVRLIVPSVQIEAPIIPIQISGDTLTPPDNPAEVGWWTGSAKPGSKTGQTLITGHTVHTGGGQMDHLGAIQQGAIIQIVTPKGTLWYRETEVQVYSKDQISQNAEQLFGQNRKHNRLILVTCTGWTGSFYTSNVVVFADPLGIPNNPKMNPLG